MPNGKSIQKENKPRQHIEVIILKLVVMLVVLILPIAFMLLDFSNVRLVYQNNTNQAQISNVNNGKVRNFEAPLPVYNSADLSAVDFEKIDTLFNNLK